MTRGCDVRESTRYYFFYFLFFLYLNNTPNTLFQAAFKCQQFLIAPSHVFNFAPPVRSTVSGCETPPPTTPPPPLKSLKCVCRLKCSYTDGETFSSFFFSLFPQRVHLHWGSASRRCKLCGAAFSSPPLFSSRLLLPPLHISPYPPACVKKLARWKRSR